MALHIGNNRCSKSKGGEPCISVCKKAQPIGEGFINKIYICKRCRGELILKYHIQDLECPLSLSGKHDWEKEENLSFQQTWKGQHIEDLERCSSCCAERRYSYFRAIPYNPHR